MCLVAKCIRLRSGPCFIVLMFVTAVNLVLLFRLYLYACCENTREFQYGSNVTGGFLVYTSSCRIPNLDPFDSSIPKIIGLKGKNIHCEGTALTYVDGTMLRFNRSVTEGKLKEDFKHCRYQTVIRNSQTDSFSHFSDFGEPFVTDVEIRDEFIRVVCLNHDEGVISVMYHAFVFPREDVEARCRARMKSHVKTAHPKEVLSVLMVGIDSMSRLNMMRQMPRTREFLLDELHAVEMVGYNKVADNTFVNLMPMLSGKYVSELPWNHTQPFDSVSIIWKNFSAVGYRTLYSEDEPEISTFTSAYKKGFLEPPVDYYFRPLANAIYRDTYIQKQSSGCVGDMLETEILLNYQVDLSRQFRNKPYFGFSFLNKLTHDHANVGGAGDDPHLRFLKKIKDERLLDNTVLIYFSDHGIRFGDFRNSYIGKFETRLPIMFIVMPSWFKSRYPKLFKNLQLNSKRLTTPFDVHETLKDILYFDGNVRNASLADRGISFFREIPESRNCTHASILPQWCMCMLSKKLPTSDINVISAAFKVMTYINSLLVGHFHLCSNLTLKVLHEAEEIVPNGEVFQVKEKTSDQLPMSQDQRSVVIYRLLLETKPSDATFEATVSINKKANTFTMAGDVTRTNAYGTQSKCVQKDELKQFCYCKNL